MEGEEAGDLSPMRHSSICLVAGQLKEEKDGGSMEDMKREGQQREKPGQRRGGGRRKGWREGGDDRVLKKKDEKETENVEEGRE